MKKKDLVSVIITSKNEDDVIGDLLKSVINQSYKNIELILVDNHSSDDTLKIAKKFKKVKVYELGPERSVQRNYGASRSKGEYLLFLDADMKLAPDVIKECIRLINSKKSIGAIVIPEQSEANTFWGKVKAFERSFYNEKGDMVTDAARFFKKSIFNKAGGYDEMITGPEDWDLPETIRELGYQTDRAHSVIYHKERITSPFVLARKKYYYALRTHRYLKKHNISLISAKTIFFLRPVFYRNWKKIAAHPTLFLSMSFMLSVELIAGSTGYLIGRFQKNE